MTANSMAAYRQKCLDAGMDDYLPKPVTRSELERCLHHWWNPQVAAMEREREAAAAVDDTDAAADAADASAVDGGELPARSEEHTSELQSLMRISYAVFCLKKKTNQNRNNVT